MTKTRHVLVLFYLFTTLAFVATGQRRSHQETMTRIEGDCSLSERSNETLHYLVCQDNVHRYERRLTPYSAYTIGRPLRIEEARESDLLLLPGIGPVRAKSIIEYRTKNRHITSCQDLIKVKGIGPKTLDKILPEIQCQIE